MIAQHITFTWESDDESVTIHRPFIVYGEDEEAVRTTAAAHYRLVLKQNGLIQQALDRTPMAAVEDLEDDDEYYIS